MSKISDSFRAFCFVLFVGHSKSKISDVYRKFPTYFVGVVWFDLEHNLSNISRIFLMSIIY